MSEWRAHVNCRHGGTRALATERMARKHVGCKRDRDSLANERRRVALRTENKAKKTLACDLANERCAARAAQAETRTALSCVDCTHTYRFALERVSPMSDAKLVVATMCRVCLHFLCVLANERGRRASLSIA